MATIHNVKYPQVNDGWSPRRQALFCITAALAAWALALGAVIILF